MKNILVIFLLIGYVNVAFSQTKVKITVNLGFGDITMEKGDGEEIPVPSNLTELKTFGLQFAALPSTEKLIVKVQGANIIGGGSVEYSNAEASTSKTFTFQTNILNSKITIVRHVLAGGPNQIC